MVVAYRRAFSEVEELSNLACLSLFFGRGLGLSEAADLLVRLVEVSVLSRYRGVLDGVVNVICRALHKS